MMRNKFFLNNIGLKLLALALAIIVWVYIVGELNKATPEEKAALLFVKDRFQFDKKGPHRGS